jgi:hypothetical protein
MASDDEMEALANSIPAELLEEMEIITALMHWKCSPTEVHSFDYIIDFRITEEFLLTMLEVYKIRPGPTINACMECIINAASAIGSIKVLDNCINNKNVPCTYNYKAINAASMYGHVHVLEWWYSHIKCKGIVYSNAAIFRATMNGHLNVLEWWYSKSIYAHNVLGWLPSRLAKNNFLHTNLFSRYDYLYFYIPHHMGEIVTLASNVDVIQWWYDRRHLFNFDFNFSYDWIYHLGNDPEILNWMYDHRVILQWTPNNSIICSNNTEYFCRSWIKSWIDNSIPTNSVLIKPDLYRDIAKTLVYEMGAKFIYTYPLCSNVRFIVRDIILLITRLRSHEPWHRKQLLIVTYYTLSLAYTMFVLGYNAVFEGKRWYSRLSKIYSVPNIKADAQIISYMSALGDVQGLKWLYDNRSTFGFEINENTTKNAHTDCVQFWSDHLVKTIPYGNTNVVCDDECAICQEVLTSVNVQLQCGHIYHDACIKFWFNLNNTCPYCREPSNVKLELVQLINNGLSNN